MTDTPLTNFLAKHLGAVPGEEAEALERLLQQVLSDSSQRWPKVNLSREVYLKRIADLCLASGPAPYALLAQLQLSELYLATACAAADPSAAVYFDEEYLSQMPAYVATLRLSPAQVEDLRLSMRERLLLGTTREERRISTYAGKSPLAKWLRVAAVRQALNRRRDKNEQALAIDAESGIANAIAQDGNQEFDYLLRRYQSEFKAAVREAFAELPEQERSILKMYYISGLKTPQIAKLHGVVNTTASRWVAEAREHVATAVQTKLQARLRLQPAEMQSIYRALRSRIDWSISTALKD